jgi:multiple sugar transport system ATP-binding protein
MNMIAAERTPGGLAAKGIELALDARQRESLATAGAGQFLYGLRPEAISFGEAGLPGTVAMIEPTGPETYALVDTALGKLTARVPGRLHHATGAGVGLRWAAADIHLFEAGSERRIA